MGIEYVEYSIKLRNKKTLEWIVVTKQFAHETGTPLYTKDDFELMGLNISYG